MEEETANFTLIILPRPKKELLVFDGETVGWFPQPDWTLLLMT
jgi:hypothetical protein